MISPKCFTLGYLNEQGEALKIADLRNREKCVLALELVSRLQRGGLDFVFKGGTSLLLHCDPARRLSIDIDILSLEPLEKFEQVLQESTRTAPFQSWEHQERRDREAPPTKHFLAFYTSAVSGEVESVQLDVICAENPYARLVKTPVNASFLEIEKETSVFIPSASCLLADKVACFAPTTIGYPYDPIVAASGKAPEFRPIKVIKHLFDIGILAEIATDAAETITTYRNIHAEQLRFRGGEFSLEDALKDTRQAAYHICRLGGQQETAGDETAIRHRKILAQGISSMASHLFSDHFQRADSQIAAAKAALAAQMILHEADTFDISKFLSESPDLVKLKTAELNGAWEHISQPLKKGNIEAFRIWHQAQLLGTKTQPFISH